MKLEEMNRNARKLYDEGFHCSQAVFITGCEKVGLQAPEVVAAMSPFGGGMGSTADVCGCLSGALAVLGLLMGKKEASEKDHRLMWKYAYKMVKQFEALTREYGGKKCSDIARIDWRDRQQVKIYYSNGPESRKKECLKVIGATAEALGTMLEDMSGKL